MKPPTFLRKVDRPPPQARLVTLCSIHYIDASGHPTSAIVKHSAPVKSDEQPYIRVLTVGADWKEVDLGWLAEVPLSSLVIHNKGTVPIDVSPVKSGPSLFTILPGRALIGAPALGAKLFLRSSATQEGKVTITGIPE